MRKVVQSCAAGCVHEALQDVPRPVCFFLRVQKHAPWRARVQVVLIILCFYRLVQLLSVLHHMILGVDSVGSYVGSPWIGDHMILGLRRMDPRPLNCISFFVPSSVWGHVLG